MPDQDEINPAAAFEEVGSPPFLSALSHELCTPLGSVLMLSEMLAEQAEKDSAGARQAERIHDAALDIRDLIDQVSLLARIQAGRLRLDLQEVSTEFLVRSLQRELEGQHLPLTTGADAPTSLVTHPQHLTDAVRRLLIGAEEGTARIHLGGEAGRHGGLWIRVWRPAEGVAEEELDSIFDPFHRAARIVCRRYGGQSLDLTIARALIEWIGGSLSAAVETSEELVFSVRLA